VNARFADDLASEFHIPRASVPMFLQTCREVYQQAMLETPLSKWGKWGIREADALDELVKLLPRTAHLLWEAEPALARVLVGVCGGEEIERLDEIRRAEVMLQLQRRWLLCMAGVAAKAPRRRRDPGKRKVRFAHDGQQTVLEEGYGPLQALMDVIAFYWTNIFGRAFEQNQAAWECDGRPKRTAPEALRFAYAVIEQIAPGQGESLKTIARSYPARYRK
jgi:hypothetical protein